MYSDYKFSTSVITIGALGAVPKNLDLNLRKLNFEKEKIAVLIQRTQRATLTGTLKVCKTVIKDAKSRVTIFQYIDDMSLSRTLINSVVLFTTS